MSDREQSRSEAEKRLAAESAAGLVAPGMTVGLGTGSTVAYLLPALAARRLDITCVATSVATEVRARELGLEVQSFSGTGAVGQADMDISRLDIAIDGADQVSPELWLVKGGGGAHTREKIVATAAGRFVVIVSSEKIVDELRAPVPLELIAFGLAATLHELRSLGECRLRDVPTSPDGGVIADYFGEIGDPSTLAQRFEAIPGIIGHGLFPPGLVTEVVIGRAPRDGADADGDGDAGGGTVEVRLSAG